MDASGVVRGGAGRGAIVHRVDSWTFARLLVHHGGLGRMDLSSAPAQGRGAGPGLGDFDRGGDAVAGPGGYRYPGRGGELGGGAGGRGPEGSDACGGGARFDRERAG